MFSRWPTFLTDLIFIVHSFNSGLSNSDSAAHHRSVNTSLTWGFFWGNWGRETEGLPGIKCAWEKKKKSYSRAQFPSAATSVDTNTGKWDRPGLEVEVFHDKWQTANRREFSAGSGETCLNCPWWLPPSCPIWHTQTHTNTHTHTEVSRRKYKVIF